MALNFNGTTDNVTVGDLTESTAYSACAWIKTAQTTQGRIVQIQRASPASSKMGIQMLTNTAQAFWADAGNVVRILAGNFAINDNTWRHVVATHDGTNVALYIDSSQNATTTSTLTALTTTLTDRLGSFNGASQFFSGVMAEVQVYGIALNANEIKQIYFGKPILKNRIGYWPLRVDASDQSGNQFNGTLIGTTLVDHAPVVAPFPQQRGTG